MLETVCAKSAELRKLLKEVAPKPGLERAAGKLLLTDLVLFRLCTPGLPDSRWLSGLAEDFNEKLLSRCAYLVGRNAQGTPFQALVDNASSVGPDLAEKLSEGLSDAYMQMMSGTGDGSPGNPGDFIADLMGLADQLSLEIIKTAGTTENRKALVSCFNAALLIEEGLMHLRAGQRASETTLIRKIAAEYAVLRIIGAIEAWSEAGLADIQSALRQLGAAARLTPLLSDSLDKAQTRARKGLQDPDLVEAAMAAGCPLKGNLSSISAACGQARKYRDRELR